MFAVAKIDLQCPRIMALVGEGEAACVPQHVRLCLEAKLGLHASTLHHASKACRGEGRSALRRDHEGRDGMLLQSSLVSIAALSPSSRNASISKLIGVRFGKPLCKMLICFTAAKAGDPSDAKTNPAIRSRRLIGSSHRTPQAAVLPHHGPANRRLERVA